MSECSRSRAKFRTGLVGGSDRSTSTRSTWPDLVQECPTTANPLAIVTGCCPQSKRPQRGREQRWELSLPYGVLGTYLGRYVLYKAPI